MASSVKISLTKTVMGPNSGMNTWKMRTLQNLVVLGALQLALTLIAPACSWPMAVACETLTPHHQDLIWLRSQQKKYLHSILYVR